MDDGDKLVVKMERREVRLLLRVLNRISEIRELRYLGNECRELRVKAKEAIHWRYKNFRECRRYEEFGYNGRGCEISFLPKRKDHLFCCTNCRKSFFEKTRPKRKRRGK